MLKNRSGHKAVLRKVVIRMCKVVCNKTMPNGTSGDDGFRTTEGKMINTCKYSWFLLPSELFDCHRTSLSFTPPTGTNYFQMKFPMHHRTQPVQVGKVKEAHHCLPRQKQKAQGPREEKDELFIP